MAKSQQTFNKSEKEKNRQKKRKDKEQRKEERKANAGNGDFNSMIAYVDENGVITSTPPDPNRKVKVKAENIQIGIAKREAGEEVSLIRTGIVTFFNDSKGFGFIRDSVTQESIFTHINGHVDTIKENNKVTFQVEKGKKGLNAVDVRVVR
jgi:cold shock CspA family protein